MHAAVHVQHGVLSAPTLRASHKIGRYPLAERGPPFAELVRLVSEESSMYPRILAIARGVSEA